jgi:hypothetical protein
MIGIAGLRRGSDPVRSDDLLDALAAVGVSEVDGDVTGLRARVAQIESGVVELGEAVLSDADPTSAAFGDAAASGESDDVSRADHAHGMPVIIANVAALGLTASVEDATDLQAVADKVDALIAGLVAAGHMTAPV